MRKNPYTVNSRPGGIKGVVLLAGLLLLTLGCGRSTVEWPGVEGTVVNAETGEPISDAIVIANWYGTGGWSQTTCFHSESARSDNEGRFTLPAWRNEGRFNKLANQYSSARAYKKGYGPDPAGWVNERILMVPFTGTREERLKYLRRLASSSACDSVAGASLRNLLPLYEAIYQEAKELSNTPEELKDLEWFRYMAADMAIASDTLISSHVEHEAKINSYLKDHLK